MLGATKMILNIITEYVVSNLLDKHKDKLPDRILELTKADETFHTLLHKKILPNSLEKLVKKYPELQQDEELTEQILSPAIGSIINQTVFSGRLLDDADIKDTLIKLLAGDLTRTQQQYFRKVIEDYLDYFRQELAVHQDAGDALIIQSLGNLRSEILEKLDSLILSKQKDNETDLIAEHTRPIFISYSRKNRAFATNLRDRLDKLGFTLWQDVHDIDAGAENWWQSITDAIKGCDTLILCMSLPALKSPIVSDEWLLARTEGKRIIPVIADDIWNHAEVLSGEFTIPNWMRRSNWVDFRESNLDSKATWQNLLRTLNKPGESKSFINMVPELPPRFVRRPELANRIISKLVDDKRDAIAMTTALRGAGGYGKTTLAKSVARDVRIQGAFDDGILWVTLGAELREYSEEKLRTTLIQKAVDLIYGLTGERININTLEMCKPKLNEAVGKRHILLVIDDVWDNTHLEPFLLNGENASCIITTRNANIVNRNRIEQEQVDHMEEIEAAELLVAGIDPDEVTKHQTTIENLVIELRRYPLLLALANTQISNWMQDMGIDLGEALEFAHRTLEQLGVLGFDDTDPSAREDAVSSTLDVSLKQLTHKERERYLELAIFPEDTLIPLSTLEAYWSMEDVPTLMYCQRLFRKTALLHSFEGKSIRLQDVFRDYIISKNSLAQLKKLHHRLVANYGDLSQLPDEYSWRNISYHINASDQLNTLYNLVLNFKYLYTKLSHTDIRSLLLDFEYLKDKDDLAIIQSALTITSHIVGSDAKQLGFQIHSRLISFYENNNTVRKLLDTITSHVGDLPPDFFVINQSIQPAGGALVRTLIRDPSEIYGMVLSGTSLISLQAGNVVNVWNWRTGELLKGYEPEIMPTSSISIYEDLIIGSNDKRIIVWNWRDEKLIHDITGHRMKISSVKIWGKNIISGSDDGYIKVWNIKTGKQIHSFYTNDWIRSISISGENVVIYFLNGVVEIWDWKKGRKIRTSSIITKKVNEVIVEDQLIVSALSDGSIKVWTLDKDEQPCLLKEHTSSVNSIALVDKSMISISNDTTINIWNLDSKEITRTLSGHNSAITHLAISEKNLITASTNGIIKVWDWAKDEQAQMVDCHTSYVVSMNSFQNLICTGSSDGLVRIWDTKYGHSIFAHENGSPATSVAFNGEVLTIGSSNKTIKIWNWKKDEFVGLLNDDRGVAGLKLSGEYLISASGRRIKVWNWHTGELQHVMEGHKKAISAIDIFDEYLVSASTDKSLRVWKWRTGEFLYSMQGDTEHTGHTDEVYDLAVLDSQVISVSIDKTLRVWDLHTGSLTKTIITDSKLIGVAVAGNIASVVQTDRKVSLWNWISGERLLERTSDVAQLVIDINNDGTRIITGDEDGQVHIFHPNSTLVELITKIP